MSIRTRLAIAVALVLAVTLTLLGAVLVRTTRATLVAQVDEQVLTSAARAEKQKSSSRGRGSGGADDHPLPGQGGADQIVAGRVYDLYENPIAHFVYTPRGVIIQADPSGFADDPKSPPWIPPIPSAQVDALVGRIVTTRSVDGSFSYRMLVQRGAGGNISVTAASLAAAEAAVDRLVRILLGVGTLALVAAALASWWLIRRGLRPVDQMVETAAAIAAGDLTRRVPDADPRTELGQLGHALNEMLAQIERAARAREASEERLRRFVADAAHELRTPLTSLRGYAELYRQGAIPDAEGVGNAMRRIESEGGRMARLVDDLLLLARLDQQRGLERKPIDLADLVREAVTDFAAVEPDRPVSQSMDGDAIVLGDPVRLRQIIDNLLANTRIHTPSGTPVHVSVTRNASHVEVSVADEGPGIALDDQARVFERFWRADPARVRSRGGTGLGLAIVASLVQAHGGTIALTSKPGQGATFTVRLPLAPPEPTGVQPQRSSSASGPGSLPVVLPAPRGAISSSRPETAHS